MIPPACASPARNLGPEEYHFGFSFECNGAGDPIDVRKPLGLSVDVTHTANVGEYLVTLGSNFSLPSAPILCEARPQFDSLGNWFDAATVGEFDPAARTVLVQTHRAGVALDVAAAAGARVNVHLHIKNSTGH